MFPEVLGTRTWGRYLDGGNISDFIAEKRYLSN